MLLNPLCMISAISLRSGSSKRACSPGTWFMIITGWQPLPNFSGKIAAWTATPPSVRSSILRSLEGSVSSPSRTAVEAAWRLGAAALEVMRLANCYYPRGIVRFSVPYLHYSIFLNIKQALSLCPIRRYSHSIVPGGFEVIS